MIRQVGALFHRQADELCWWCRQVFQRFSCGSRVIFCWGIKWLKSYPWWLGLWHDIMGLLFWFTVLVALRSNMTCCVFFLVAPLSHIWKNSPPYFCLLCWWFLLFYHCKSPWNKPPFGIGISFLYVFQPPNKHTQIFKHLMVVSTKSRRDSFFAWPSWWSNSFRAFSPAVVSLGGLRRVTSSFFKGKPGPESWETVD